MARYRKLGYAALGVSDVARSSSFYENMVGLARVGTGPHGEVFLRCSQDHHNIVLVPGKVGLHRLGWEMESPAEVARIAERARSAAAASKRPRLQRSTI